MSLSPNGETLTLKQGSPNKNVHNGHNTASLQRDIVKRYSPYEIIGKSHLF